MNVRQTRRALSFTAVALLLAAPALALAGGSPGEPRLELRAADNRRAKFALIRKSDLISGFRADPQVAGVPMIPHCTDFPGDRSGTTITGYAKSSFGDGMDVIGSSSTVFKSERDLDRYWALTVRPRFASCDASAYARTRAPGLTTKTLMARPLPLQATGAQRAAAFRTVTQVSAKGHSPADWYQTVVFLGEGRALAAIKIGYVDKPCSCYAGLARRLAGRLIAASHG
jgi:hypothetical protein